MESRVREVACKKTFEIKKELDEKEAKRLMAEQKKKEEAEKIKPFFLKPSNKKMIGK